MFAEINPFLALLTGTLVVALVSLVAIIRQHQRLDEMKAERQRLEAVAVKARELLAAAPEGLFHWDHPNGGFTCSRRLAVLLGLDAGIHVRYEDIRDRFEGESLKALERGVSLLRAKGTTFDLLLTLDRQRRIQAIGTRAKTGDGKGLGDMVWMRDMTDADVATGHSAPVNTSGLDDRHLTALLDAMPLPVWLRDSKLALAFVNRAAQNIAVSEAGMADRARRQGKPLTERRALGGNGSKRLLEITETPLGPLGGGDDGDPTGGTIGFAVDRMALEKVEFQRPGADRDSVLEGLDSAIAIFGASTGLQYFNPAYARLWDLDADWLWAEPELGAILERLREARLLPEVADFRDFKRRQLERFETLGEPMEDLLHLPDGRTIRSIVNRHGKGGLVFVFEDVSDRLDLERSYKSLNAVQGASLDNLQEGVAVFGSDGRLKLSNPVFGGLWGLEEQALDGKFHVTAFVDHIRQRISVKGGWDDRSWGAHKNRVMARLMNRESSTGQIELANGTVVNYANVPLPDGAVLLSYLDVTDTVRVEQALRQRADVLAEADRLKAEFIANVSYEVRTPLNTIIGFADMLGQEYFGGLNRRQSEYARGILDTTRGLMSVVSDILDLASIEAGRMELDRDTVDVHGLLVSVLNLIGERTRRKDLKVSFDCPPDIGWIIADDKRLKQVVFNLLSNALTFTPERGSIRLEARREEDDLIIVVSDTGIGIPQADRERVFKPFERGGDPKTDKSGAGLGLSLVRNFIELHGGSVEVKSLKGRGTSITCRLPASDIGLEEG